MVFPDYLYVLVKIITGMCIPFTILAIILCCVMRQDGVYVTYYMDLLICNVIQQVTVIVTVANTGPYWDHEVLDSLSFRIFGWGMMVSLCFRMAIALERYFFISCPQLLCIKNIKGLEMVFVLVWVLCFVCVPFVIAFQQEYAPVIFLFLFPPVFIICFAGTLKSLPAATSLPTEEKQRTVGILAVLLVNNILTILPNINYSVYTHFNPSKMEEVFFVLFLLSPCMDLILFVFMCKGFNDNLLMYLCCCWIEDPAGNESNRSSV